MAKSARAAAVAHSLQDVFAGVKDLASLGKARHITADAAICRLMGEFPDNEDIQLHACGALLLPHMSFSVPQRCIAAVTRAMVAHPDSAMLQTLACGVLKTVCLCNRNWADLRANGSVGAIVWALTRHRGSARVVTVALDVLRRAAQDPDVSEALVHSDAGDAVMEVYALAPLDAAIVLERICVAAVKRVGGARIVGLLSSVSRVLTSLLTALQRESCTVSAVQAGHALCGVLAKADLRSDAAQAQLRTMACAALSAM